MKQSINNNQLFKKIIDILYQENHHHNLSGIKDWQGMYDQHILDSKALSEYLIQDNFSNNLVYDLGSGAGFPGLVISLEHSDKKVIMVDSNNKKASFINKIINDLKIENSKALNKRIEELGCPEDGDVVCAKALASLDVLLEYAYPLLKKDGFLIAMKSSDFEKELSNALPVASLLGFDYLQNVPYFIFQKKRQLLVFKKSKKSKYELPRKNGEAKNKPLRSKLCESFL